MSDGGGTGMSILNLRYKDVCVMAIVNPNLKTKVTDSHHVAQKSILMAARYWTGETQH